MKKGLKVVIISCLAMSLLAGCGGKKPSASRVESANFTFTSEEFKTDFNDAVGFGGGKLKDFTGSKKEDSDGYIYLEKLDDTWIIADSITENGKLTDVSVNFEGGKESATDTSLSELKLTKGEMNTIKKLASAAFDTCEPNVDTKKFEEFLDNNLTNATILKDASEEIGDLKVSLNTKTSIEFEFEPKGEK